MEERSSLDRSYFETLYSQSVDPWDFRTSPYEQRKYAATLDILSRPRYARALEVGCSIGVLTRLLAGRCDRVAVRRHLEPGTRRSATPLR